MIRVLSPSGLDKSSSMQEYATSSVLTPTLMSWHSLKTLNHALEEFGRYDIRDQIHSRKIKFSFDHKLSRSFTSHYGLHASIRERNYVINITDIIEFLESHNTIAIFQRKNQ